MLRLDPGDVRVATARQFQVWEGGGEYNVARGLRRCFGLKTAIVTALADNPVGRLVEDLMLQGGVDLSHVVWIPTTALAASTQRVEFSGAWLRRSRRYGLLDRGHTAISQLKPGQIDWDEIFGKKASRWLHTGGIMARARERATEVVREAMQAAKRHGTSRQLRLQLPPVTLEDPRRPRRAPSTSTAASCRMSMCSLATRAISPRRIGPASRIGPCGTRWTAMPPCPPVSWPSSPTSRSSPGPSSGRHGQHQRLGRIRLGRRPGLRGHEARRSRDPRPRRRRRFVRLGHDLRLLQRQGHASGRWTAA